MGFLSRVGRRAEDSNQIRNDLFDGLTEFTLGRIGTSAKMAEAVS